MFEKFGRCIIENDIESDTPSEAGGLMSVTASKAGVLAEGYLLNP